LKTRTTSRIKTHTKSPKWKTERKEEQRRTYIILRFTSKSSVVASVGRWTPWCSNSAFNLDITIYSSEVGGRLHFGQPPSFYPSIPSSLHPFISPSFPLPSSVLSSLRHGLIFCFQLHSILS
jgi:hypothetical protein